MNDDHSDPSLDDPYYPGKDIQPRAETPQLDEHFWSKLHQELSSTKDPEERMSKLIQSVTQDSIIGKWSETNLDEDEKQELIQQLEPLFSELTSYDMATLDENARGKLLYIKKKLNFSKPRDSIFGKRGIISPDRLLEIIKKTKLFIEAIDKDADLVADLEQFNGSKEHPWDEEKRKAVLQKMMNHLANTYGLDTHIVKLHPKVSDNDRHTWGAAATYLYPPHLDIYPPLFNQNVREFITTFAHEGIHLFQAQIRYQVKSKNSPLPQFDEENDKLNKALLSSQDTTLKQPAALVGKHDKYGANINAWNATSKLSYYRYSHRTNNEREAFVTELAAAIWLAKSEHLNQGNVFLKDIDPFDSRGDLQQTVAMAIESRMETTLRRILERPHFFKPSNEDAVIPVEEAWGALRKFDDLCGENPAVESVLHFALECRVPKFAEIASDETGFLHQQVTLIEELLRDRHDTVRESVFGEDFVFPKDEKALQEKKTFFEKIISSYPDELCRQIVFELACDSIEEKDPAVVDKLKQIIFDVPPLRKVDIDAVRNRVGKDGNTIPKKLRNEQYIVPFYQRGKLCLAEVTNIYGSHTSERSIVVLQDDSDYGRLKTIPVKIKEFIDSNISKNKPRPLMVHPPLPPNEPGRKGVKRKRGN